MSTLNINLGEWAIIAQLNEQTGGEGPEWESGLGEILGPEVAARCIAEDPAVKVHPAGRASDGRLYDADEMPIERFTSGPAQETPEGPP